MVSALLEALYQTIHGNAEILAAVDSQIFKNKALEESGPLLKAANKTLISCELIDLDGSKNSTEPTFIVDVRCKKSYEYCAEVVQLIKELLDDGFTYSGTTVNVHRIDAPILVSRELVGWRSQMRVYGTVNAVPAITSLTANLSAPQPAEQDITFICVAADSNLEEIQYRFLISGPGTGNVYRDMTGWTSRNSFVWKTKTEDVGTSTI
jgi:hypothetical protein